MADTWILISVNVICFKNFTCGLKQMPERTLVSSNNGWPLQKFQFEDKVEKGVLFKKLQCSLRRTFKHRPVWPMYMRPQDSGMLYNTPKMHLTNCFACFCKYPLPLDSPSATAQFIGCRENNVHTKPVPHIFLVRAPFYECKRWWPRICFLYCILQKHIHVYHFVIIRRSLSHTDAIRYGGYSAPNNCPSCAKKP